MEKWDFNYFAGELNGELPLIVSLRQGKVKKLIIEKGGIFVANKISYLADNWTGIKLGKKEMYLEEWENAKLDKKIRRILESGDTEKEKEVITAFNKQIKQEKLLTSELLVWTSVGKPFIPSYYRPIEIKGNIEPYGFTGQLLTTVFVETEWWPGKLLEETVIQIKEGIGIPKKWRRRSNVKWADLSKEAQVDFYSVIHQQPLISWNICGDKVQIGNVREIEKEMRKRMTQEASL